MSFDKPRVAPAAQGTHPTKSDPSQEDVNRRFKAAVAAYQARDYIKALRELQPLLEAYPNSFEINEMTGLVYVALGQDDKANTYLARAVQLRPNVAAACTTLAANLVRLHRDAEAEAMFRKVVGLEPGSYDANHNLGEFYIQTGRLVLAIPYLERAYEINPRAYNNAYDLALAYVQTGDLEKARGRLQELIRVSDTAELHVLLGEVEENARHYLASAAQYEQAARMDPSENNILAWGTELLLHQTFEPAVEVFKAGLARYPRSYRLETGLGIASYGLGQFDEGAGAFFQASDMNPPEPLPLVFLGKAYENLSPPVAAEVRSRLKRFMETDPRNASVRYYYAMSLWKQSQGQPQAAELAEIESLLRTAISLDPEYADAYLQLGILYSSQRNYSDAISQYQQALKYKPDVAVIHYRLGQALARSGATARAQQEFAEFERLHAREVTDTDRQTADIQQFLYTVRNPKATAGRQ